jgi:hypothetical protein
VPLVCTDAQICQSLRCLKQQTYRVTLIGSVSLGASPLTVKTVMHTHKAR